MNPAKNSSASALWIAAAANLVDSTKSLLEGAVLPQHSANQAIIVASYYGHTDIVHILLDKGADANAAGGEYGSSLQAAAKGGHTAIVRILLDKGADINAAEGEYGSSLQASAQGGHTEIVGILLDRGADINAAGGAYGSSLQAAAQCGRTEIVHMLMEWGADEEGLAAGEIFEASMVAVFFGGGTQMYELGPDWRVEEEASWKSESCSEQDYYAKLPTFPEVFVVRTGRTNANHPVFAQRAKALNVKAFIKGLIKAF
ncbi:ankyrin repeat-containing domain protein [Mycena galopus ATCC 62051]|nr:ankyrin repeat-containing domain protein [Mycena galopus ATCC 62051]